MIGLRRRLLITALIAVQVPCASLSVHAQTSGHPEGRTALIAGPLGLKTAIAWETADGETTGHSAEVEGLMMSSPTGPNTVLTRAVLKTPSGERSLPMDTPREPSEFGVSLVGRLIGKFGASSQQNFSDTIEIPGVGDLTLSVTRSRRPRGQVGPFDAWPVDITVSADVPRSVIAARAGGTLFMTDEGRLAGGSLLMRMRLPAEDGRGPLIQTTRTTIFPQGTTPDDIERMSRTNPPALSKIPPSTAFPLWLLAGVPFSLAGWMAPRRRSRWFRGSLALLLVLAVPIAVYAAMTAQEKIVIGLTAVVVGGAMLAAITLTGGMAVVPMTAAAHMTFTAVQISAVGVSLAGLGVVGSGVYDLASEPRRAPARDEFVSTGPLTPNPIPGFPERLPRGRYEIRIGCSSPGIPDHHSSMMSDCINEEGSSFGQCLRAFITNNGQSLGTQNIGDGTVTSRYSTTPWNGSSFSIRREQTASAYGRQATSACAYTVRLVR